MTRSLADMAHQLGELLLQHGQTMVTAESCTGGLIAATCTDIAGSSAWLHAGFVTYQLSAKVQLLGVDAHLIEKEGVVSEPVARAMALGALERSHADVAVSVTGIAGPGGGEALQPVGTVWFAWATRSSTDPSQTSVYQFSGSREDVRVAATRTALDGLIRVLD